MLKVENLSYMYKHGAKKVLDRVCFEVGDGQAMAVLGNNGAGKSTLIKCIDRILPVSGAKIEIDGRDVLTMSAREMAQNIAYVPQSSAGMSMTVFDAVLLGRRPYIKWDASADDRRIAADIIRRMGLEGLALRNVSELSGGEAQKVMIARALAQQPKLLLLDEPTSNLDPYNQHEVMHIVRDLAHEEKISVILIIHDLNLAARHCDRFLFLKNGGVYCCGGTETVTAETLRNVYDIDVEIIEHKGKRIIVPLS